jgi:hypothetical protein
VKAAQTGKILNVLQVARAAGVEIAVVNGKLATRGVITSELHTLIRDNKAGLFSLLGLQSVIAECLAAHAEAMQRFGTEQPELADVIPVELRNRMQRQRAKVASSLVGDDPAVHAQHVAALTKGLRLVMRKLDPSCS